MSDESVTFSEFTELVDALSSCSSHKQRSKIVAHFIHQGSEAGPLLKETSLVLKFLLPGMNQQTYNLKDKQLVNYYSDIFHCFKDDMLEDLEQGDISDTLCKFFKKNSQLKPARESTITLKEVNSLLEQLSEAEGEAAKVPILKKCAKICTVEDFRILIRLIKKDLRISAGAKQILDALGDNAYEAFQASRDLDMVIAKITERSGRDQISASSSGSGKPRLSKKISISISLMTPVLPMLAKPGRSAEVAIESGRACGGLIVEIKYDGERVQIHKRGNTFKYFSRSLKPVPPNKVGHLKDFIPKAFPNANDLILDSEILLLDTKTKKPLPFGTLGSQKRTAFKDATVCIFVFDCLYINGRTLLNTPMIERREILEQNMNVVPDHVLLSEKHQVLTKEDLNKLMARVFSEGLEGLVLKEADSIYEPGKRHWMKIKKDYLGEGAMADSADLIVLGAYFGTGNKGGLMSVFLMGAYDPQTKTFCTVTKCGNGLDDRTLLKLQKKLNMVKISKDVNRVPSWLNVSRSLVPDFVAADPKKSQVWEIVGTEFTRSTSHTAGTGNSSSSGISIRFPRVTKIRDDKTWNEATDVDQLETLLATSTSLSDWNEKLENISASTSSPGKRNNNAAILPSPSKKPKLVPIPPPHHQTTFKHLNSLFDGFIIAVPGAVVKSDVFNHLKRRLIASGAKLKLDDELDKEDVTHVIVEESDHEKNHFGVPITLSWLRESISSSKLLPLPPPV